MRHGRRLGEAAAGVGIDHRALVEEGRADGGVLHHVIDFAHFPHVGDGFVDDEDAAFTGDAGAAADVETGFGEGRGHNGFCGAAGSHFPGDAGGFPVIRDAGGEFAGRGLAPAIEAEEVRHGAESHVLIGGPEPGERVEAALEFEGDERAAPEVEDRFGGAVADGGGGALGEERGRERDGEEEAAHGGYLGRRVD